MNQDGRKISALQFSTYTRFTKIYIYLQTSFPTTIPMLQYFASLIRKHCSYAPNQCLFPLRTREGTPHESITRKSR